MEHKLNEFGNVFGKGEYALTPRNLQKLVSNCKDFQAAGHKWVWALQDNLGIKPTGERGDRFHQIQAALKDSKHPDVVALLAAMNDCPVNVIPTRTLRPTAPLGPRKGISNTQRDIAIKAMVTAGVTPEQIAEFNKECDAHNKKMEEERAAKAATTDPSVALKKLGYSQEKIDALLKKAQ